MDPESPIGRMGRTFWTVWYYITGAVNRFLRPEPTDVTSNDPNSIQESAVDSEPTNITSNDPNSIQESAVDSEPTNITSNDPNSIQESTVDSEPANFSQTEGDTSGRGVDEEQALASASLLSSFRPLVAWEVCTTDLDLKTDEESVPCKTQLSGGSESKASEGGGGTREEQLANAGNNDTGLFFAKDDKQEENIDQKLCTRGRDEMPENEEYEEHVNATLTGDAVSEDMEKSARGAEETEKAPHDPQKMDETIQVKEADDKMQLEDEQHLQAEDTEVKLCQIAGLSLGEEDNMHVEEVKVQRNEADEEVENSDGVPKLAFENECDKGTREAENQLSVCEELSDDHRDFNEVPGFASQHVELQMTYDKSSFVSEDELIVVEQERVMAHWSESDNVEDAKEKEDENTVDEVAVVEEENVNEAANNQITDDAQVQRDNIKTVTEEDILPEHVTCNEEVLQNAPKQEDNIKTLTEEEDVLTEHVACSEEVMQSAASELHTVEFTYREQGVAKDTKVQTKTKDTDDVEAEYDGSLTDEQSDMKTTPISVDESFSDQEAEEMLLNEVSNKESYTEIAHTATSVPVQPEGETGEEMSGEFKNIPPRICEGPAVVSQELNSQTCEETQEGVPEYNNELGPDENTTQRFLEDCEEIQTSPLPEEVESKEPESLRNSGWSSGADCLLVRELMEEKQDIKKSFDSDVEDKGGILQLTEAGSPQETEGPLIEAVIQKSGHLVEEEEELPVDSMKTEIEQKTEKEFESDVGLTDEFNKMTNEPQDGMEELLVDLGKDEGLCDSIVAVAAGETRDVAAEEVLVFADETFSEAKAPKMTETSFQEFIDTITSEQNSNLTPSLLEDIAESGFLKHSDAAESKLLEDIAMPGAQDVDETGYGVEKETAGHEMQGRDEMEILHLQSTAKAETGMSGPVESLATKNQLSDEALENSNEEILPKEAAESIMAESKSKYSTLVSIEDTSMGVTESEGSFTEETFSSISGRQDIIDEATLDLWRQTALSGDTDETQEGPENGQQTEPSNEDQGEISSMQQEESKEQLVDLVSDLEMSSSTVESGFSDQSLGEVGTQSSETQLLKSTSAESFQGICDKLENVSESVDISEFTSQHSESLVRETSVTDLKQEELVTATGFRPDSGVTSPEATDLNQESDKSQEEADKERVEPVELETGSQIEISDEVVDQAMKTDRKDTEEANIKSEITGTEDEPLEMSYSPDELKHTESGRSRSSSEALLEEEVELTESGSQGESCTESERKLLKLPSLDKPQPRWSEDVTGSLAAAEEAEQQATKSDEQMEVDAFVLDFTVQRSRIAIKNPRVRPPKDPRSLLHMPSLDPTPSSPLPVKAPVGMPLGGLGIGIKLPGLGAGFPVLKKTQRVVRDENSPETLSEETKAEEKSDTPKQEEAQRKPKWMPPRHPGFGNPLMSELKTKLKKTNE